MFVRLISRDKTAPGNDTEILVNLNHIVSIQSLWRDANGKQVQVTIPDAEAIEQGLTRNYMLMDCLGKRYSTQRASQRCKDYVGKLWLEAL